MLIISTLVQHAETFRKIKVTTLDSRRNDSIAMEGIDPIFKNISSKKTPVTDFSMS